MPRLIPMLKRGSRELLSLTVWGGQLRMMVSRGDQVLWHHVVPLNPEFLEGGVIAQPEAVASSIRLALESAELKGVNRCVAALPGFHCLTAVVDLPSAREVRPDEVLPREARRLFSYRPESSLLSWWKVPLTERLRRYAVVVTRRAALRSMAEVASEAGLRLDAVDCGPLALARAANVSEGVVVQAESDGCEVVVLKSGALGLVRSAFWGADVVDAETLASRVVDLVERSIASHNDSNAMGPLSSSAPVYLSGAAAEMVEPQVSDSLGRALAEMTPPLTYPQGMPLGELVVNLGMALREVA